jgi:tetratricopeptide (TPR) repeat protein
MATGRWLLAAILLAAAAAFVPLQRCEFVFDDLASVRDNLALQFGVWWESAFGRVHSPIAGRPLICAWFAFDWWVSGGSATWFRVVNLALHLANVALVAAVARGALSAPNLRGRFAPARARDLALAIAAVWAVHPLAVDAVAYTTQRTTLAMTLCMLAALRSLQRSHTAAHGRRWQGLATLFLALGMLCKEEMIGAPLLLLLHDRAFFVASWQAMRARLPFHLLAAAVAWTLLLACMLGAPHNSTVGYDTQPRASALDWLRTQAGIVVHYLRSALWPSDLRGYYDWPIVRESGPAVLPGLLVLALLALTVAAWRRAPWWGWLGALFFVLLAPTSSVLPIVTELIAERRAYLPMLAALVPAVLLLDRALRRWTGRRARFWLLAAIALVVAAAAAVTRSRVAVYRDLESFWSDNYRRHACPNGSFPAGMILSNYALVVRVNGDLDRAIELFRQALQCAAPTPVDRMLYAMTLAQRGNYAMAEPVMRSVVADAPDLPDGHGNFATMLVDVYLRDAREHQRGAQDPRLLEALAHARTAVELNPRRAAYANTLAWLLVETGHGTEAEPFYRRAIELEPDRIETWINLADLLLQQSRLDEARQLMQRLLLSKPADVDLRMRLAIAMLERHDLAGAEAFLRDAQRLDPRNATVAQLLARVLRERGR